MKLIWALVGCVCLAQVQAAVWIDLSGPWLLDGKQEVRLPLQGRMPAGLHEYTRTIELPAEARGVPLALTVGAIAEWYEIWIDGARVASFGSRDAWDAPLARPQTFNLAPIDRAQIAIRIRAQPYTGLYSLGWLLADSGPYVLSSPAAAPRHLGALAIAQRKLLRVNDLTQPLMMACLAIVVWVIFLNDRRKRALLWVGLLLTTVVATRLWIYVQIGEDTTPFRYALWFNAIRLWGVCVCVAELAAAVIDSPRRLTWAVWGAALVGSMQGFSPIRNWATLLIFVLLAVGIVVGFLRHKPRRPWLALSLLLVIYTLQSSTAIYAPGLNLLPPVSEIFLVGIRFSPFTVVVTILSLLLTVELVRDLLRDRDDKLRMARDLESARTVQRILLPPAKAAVKHLDTSSVYEPAQEVGGDFYILDPTSNGGLLAVVGDVSGKGLKAAMIVSLIVGALRNRRSERPGDILAELNGVLHGQMDGGFATCVAVHVDSSGEARAASAGHLAPYLGGQELAVPQGLPLGLMADIEYDECAFQLTGQLTLVSDGVVEAANPADELFGFERTRELSGKAAAAIADAARAWGQNDDITVVTVRRAA